MDVVSFNVFVGVRNRGVPARERAVRFCRRLTESGVDVLLLQEVWTRGLLRFIAARLPALRHAAWRPGPGGQPAGGLVVLSRLPLRPSSFSTFAGARPGCGSPLFRGVSALYSRLQGVLTVRTADGAIWCSPRRHSSTAAPVSCPTISRRGSGWPSRPRGESRIGHLDGSRVAYPGGMPDSLRGVVTARPGGWRLVVAPDRVRELVVAFGAGLWVPLVVAGPLAVVLLVLGVVLDSSSLLLGGLIVAGLGVAVGVLLGASLAVGQVRTLVRWVDFLVTEAPARLVVARFSSSSAVALEQLRRVVVVDYVRLGERTGIEVLLHTGGADSVVCQPGQFNPLRQADSRALVDRLTELLTPTGTTVEHQTSVQHTKAPIEHWWSAQRVASTWQVPVDAVAELARQHGVASHTYAPRIGAMHQPGRRVHRYDPDAVHAATDEIRAQQPQLNP